jgi:hypothetical protein
MIRYQKNPRVSKSVVVVDGVSYSAKYIGKGQYSRVFRVGDRVVYYTRGDCTKEVMALFQYDRMAHLPEIVRHENINTGSGTQWYVFSSPFYRDVKRSDTSAYRLMNDIITMYKEFWKRERDYQYQAYGRVYAGLKVMQNFVDEARQGSSVIPRSIVKALQEMVDVVSNCGASPSFDFHKKNFGVNEYGTLIFRDPMYVLET